MCWLYLNQGDANNIEIFEWKLCDVKRENCLFFDWRDEIDQESLIRNSMRLDLWLGHIECYRAYLSDQLTNYQTNKLIKLASTQILKFTRRIRN